MEKRKNYFCFLFLVLLNLPLFSQSIGPQDIDLLLHQKIPTRDGIHLSANIFKPAQMNVPLPAIMVLTPYVSDHNTKRGIYFARHGYVFVSVDTRGRGNSEGVFTPFESEGKDGYDVLEWIASQPWCNGKIGLMGGSYKGMVQWLILKENPPHLTSIAPTATVCPGIDATRNNNIYMTFILGKMFSLSGKTIQRLLPSSDYTKEKVKQYYTNHTQYANLLKGALETPGNHLQKVFKRWISHPTLDDYWKNMLPSPEDYAKIDIPIMVITGYFDGDQPGTMHYYTNFQKYASKKAKSKMFLIYGPWDHGGTRRPVAELGGLNFGEASVLDIFDIHRQWFDWTMKNGKKPDFLQDNVWYFQMGSNEWKYASSLETIANHTLTYYLSSKQKQSSDVFHSGQLTTKKANDAEPDTLMYNPLTSAFKDNYMYVNQHKNYLTDQSYIIEKGWLYYHTPVLSSDIDIAGYITLDAFIEINTPDTDFYYKLYEIKPNGDNVLLAKGLMRVRYRNSLEKAELVEPDTVNQYRMKSLCMLCRKVEKGSRLRLLFGYLDSPDYQKNYNSGKDVSYESGKDARTATIKIYCNEKFPSSIEIPIFR